MLPIAVTPLDQGEDPGTGRPIQGRGNEWNDSLDEDEDFLCPLWRCLRLDLFRALDSLPGILLPGKTLSVMIGNDGPPSFPDKDAQAEQASLPASTF